MSAPQQPNDDKRTVLPTDEARQAVTGHNVLYVLGIGLGGAILGFLLISYLAAHGWLSPA